MPLIRKPSYWPHLVFETGSLVTWDSLIHLAWLASRPQKSPCLCSQCHSYRHVTLFLPLSFSRWVLGLNSGPCACMVSTLLTEPSAQPPRRHFLSEDELVKDISFSMFHIPCWKWGETWDSSSAKETYLLQCEHGACQLSSHSQQKTIAGAMLHKSPDFAVTTTKSAQ